MKDNIDGVSEHVRFEIAMVRLGRLKEVFEPLNGLKDILIRFSKMSGF